MPTNPVQVTVWNENIHDREDPKTQAVYPHGIHTAIAQALNSLLGDQVRTRTATLEQPEHGLSQEVLAATDVLIWWGHVAHKQVSDDVVDRVQRRVLDGMG